ncbi:MAG: hypothetical protein E6G62_10685 [Actinobacteria bacterium]|nr:MAG: hypothetical protein E6G62_10685 [Actinomycetota bacterium]
MEPSVSSLLSMVAVGAFQSSSEGLVVAWPLKAMANFPPSAFMTSTFWISLRLVSPLPSTATAAAIGLVPLPQTMV